MPTIFVNGVKRQYEKGTTFETIVQEFQEANNYSIALVYFNGKMRELSKRIDRDGVVSFITTGTKSGHNAYNRTATMIFVKAVHDVVAEIAREGTKLPADGDDVICAFDPREIHVRQEFALGKAFFCSVFRQEEDDDYDDEVAVEKKEFRFRVDDAFAARVKARMESIVSKALPIGKKTYPIDDAVSLFRHQGMSDKVKLFRYRNSSTVNVYNIEGFYDYYYGYMLPNTAYLRHFDVTAYRGGLLLHTPGIANVGQLEKFNDQPRLYEQLMLSTEWGELVGISTVGDLNERICTGGIRDMILVQEALQERRIGDIAEQIYERKDVRFILVAGPSSSGKTTLAHRLSIQLQSFGLRPHILSMDNWFVNREKTPVDIDGNYNFDVIEALDLDLFNEDLLDLLDGEEVDLPTFDFKIGKRVYNNNKLRLGDSDVLIIEGIHGLNPISTKDLPEESKFKIYASALTSLNVDEHNRIASSDTRLLRRIVRDHRLRDKSPENTILEWKKVREAEEKNIFPYQQDVDVIFNSVLIYEQAVLKQYAEPLLYSVPKESPAYYEAKRLIKFLGYFVGVDTESLPMNSICREFVGGGCFPV